MSLLYYESKFSSLWRSMNANRRGPRSPHKIALLLAVIDLIESGQIQDNRFYFDNQLEAAFKKRFQEIRTKIDQPLLQEPYFHLHSSGFWHLRLKLGRDRDVAYSDIKKRHSRISIIENIQYAYLDKELFEYLGYTFAQELLRTALHRNLLPDEETLDMGREQWEWPDISNSNWGILIDTQPPVLTQVMESSKPSQRKSGKVDYEKRAHINRERGINGEKLVLINEIIKLRQAGRDNLIADVEWTSQLPDGDGKGYDIRSFRLPEASELFIEVKTTTGNDRMPFFITNNEVKFSKKEAKQYELHRVYNFKKNKLPKRFILDGAMHQHPKIDLYPTEFMAKIKPSSSPATK